MSIMYNHFIPCNNIMTSYMYLNSFTYFNYFLSWVFI